jgi:hypothetical protein
VPLTLSSFNQHFLWNGKGWLFGEAFSVKELVIVFYLSEVRFQRVEGDSFGLECREKERMLALSMIKEQGLI